MHILIIYGQVGGFYNANNQRRVFINEKRREGREETKQIHGIYWLT